MINILKLSDLDAISTFYINYCVMPLLEYLTRVTLEKYTFRKRFCKIFKVCFHIHCSKTVHFHLGNNIMLLYISIICCFMSLKS